MRQSTTLVDVIEYVVFFAIYIITVMILWKGFNIVGWLGLFLSFIISYFVYSIIIMMVCAVFDKNARS